MISRRAAPEEQPALQALWQRVFGDGPEVTEAFFRFFPPEVHTRVIGAPGPIASMASWIPVTLCTRDAAQRGAYLYAVATAPEHRGRGLARTLLGELEQALAGAGMDFACLCPAERSLYDYYGAQGYEAAFYCTRFHAQTGQESALTPVDAQTYRSVRRSCLAAPYCEWDDAAYAYLQATGTRLYTFPGGCAAISALPDGSARVPELLADRPAQAAAKLGLPGAEVFAPGIKQPRGMIKYFTFGQKIPRAYLGFSFD